MNDEIKLIQPQIGKEEKRAALDVLTSGNLVAGEKTQELEDRVAHYIGVDYCIATSSGTAAIDIVWKAVKAQSVRTSPYSFLALPNAIKANGGRIKYIDIAVDYNVQPELFIKNIKQDVLFPVSLFGRACPLNFFEEYVGEDTILIEDACQSMGAESVGRKSGSFGDAGVFSLHPAKNMVCGGEGGLITTNRKDIRDFAMDWRHHGQKKGMGLKLRMGEIEAAIAIEQLKKLDKMIDARNKRAELYNNNLDSRYVILPTVGHYNKHTYSQYVLYFYELRHKIQVQIALNQNNIGTGVYYPKLLPDYPHLKENREKRYFCARMCTTNTLAIPVHPGVRIGKDGTDRIINTINEAMNR